MAWLSPGAAGSLVFAAVLALGAAAPARTDAACVADVAASGLASGDAEVRATAIAQGQEQALATVLRRITAARDHARLAAATGPNVAGYIAETGLLPDGRLRVAVRPDAVRHMLEQFGIACHDRPAPVLVVVPVRRRQRPGAVDGRESVARGVEAAGRLWVGPGPGMEPVCAAAGDVDDRAAHPILAGGPLIAAASGPASRPCGVPAETERW